MKQIGAVGREESWRNYGEGWVQGSLSVPRSPDTAYVSSVQELAANLSHGNHPEEESGTAPFDPEVGLGPVLTT